MVAVSVVVLDKDFRSTLGGLIESLDLQSLPTTAFEVVVVDQGSTDGTLERLRRIVTHRPNFRLFESDEDTGGVAGGEPVRPEAWLPECRGDYVLRLRANQLLFPEALERMYDRARQQEADALVARVSQPGAGLDELFTADRPQVDPVALPTSLTGAAVLVRRSLLEAAAADGALPPEATRVTVLSSYPALRQPADVDPGDAAPTWLMRQDQPSCAWQEGVLRVDVDGVLTAGGPLEVDLAGARVIAVVRHVTTGLSYLLEAADSSVAGGLGGQWTWSLTVDLDVSSAALGRPMSSGLWEIDIHLLHGSGRPPAPVTLAWTACPPAVIDRTIVVTSPTAAETFQLDVGPTTWPLVRGVDPGNGTVTESAAGSRMVLALPYVYVRGAESIPGEIALDSLRLRATIVTDGSSARLEGFVSGLFGSPHLSTAFGELSMKPTGLGLDISGLGSIVVAKAKPKAKPAEPPAATPAPAKKAPAKKAPAKKAPAKKAAAKKAAAKKVAAKKAPDSQAPADQAASKSSGPVKPSAPPAPATGSPVQALRRALPKSLDPAVQRIAANPWARRLYRKAIKPKA